MREICTKLRKAWHREAGRSSSLLAEAGYFLSISFFLVLSLHFSSISVDFSFFYATCFFDSLSFFLFVVLPFLSMLYSLSSSIPLLAHLLYYTIQGYAMLACLDSPVDTTLPRQFIKGTLKSKTLFLVLVN